MSRKVLIIGLDGGTWGVLKPLMDKGYMPYLQEVVDSGASGVLRSTVPPVTAVAWASFQTGVSPGTHGVFGFQNLVSGDGQISFQAVSSKTIGVKTLWEYLSEHGRQVIVVNCPLTYPPFPVNGLLVTGFLTPSTKAQFTYPPQLKEEILKLAPGYTIPTPGLEAVPHMERMTDVRLEAYVDHLINVTKDRVRVTGYLMDHYSWDLLMFQFQETDWLQHRCWPYLDPDSPEQPRYAIVAKFYSAVDEGIRELAERISSDDFLLVMSDHGFQEGRREFYINRWLRKKGYLVTDRGMQAKAYSILIRLYRCLDLNVRKRLVTREMRSRLLSRIVNTQVNWENTKAYALPGGETGYAGLYFFNEGTKNEVQLEILRDLKELRDPRTSEMVLDQYLAVDHSRDSTALAPRIWICCKNGFAINGSFDGKEIFRDKVVGRDYQIGIHHPDGILAVQGPGVKRGRLNHATAIIDIAPTIAHLLGLPIPSYMQGQIIAEAYGKQFLKEFPPQVIVNLGTRATGSITPEEEEEIAKHLRDLGYLE